MYERNKSLLVKYILGNRNPGDTQLLFQDESILQYQKQKPKKTHERKSKNETCSTISLILRLASTPLSFATAAACCCWLAVLRCCGRPNKEKGGAARAHTRTQTQAQAQTHTHMHMNKLQQNNMQRKAKMTSRFRLFAAGILARHLLMCF